MAEIELLGEPVVDSLRRHVLTPPADAQSLVRDEREEVEAERDAFERLRERVAGIPTVSSPTTPPKKHTVAHRADSQQVDQLRSTFRETVMGVSHYDDVYGEPLAVHVTVELSPEIATGFQRDGTPFTDAYKTQLNAAVGRAVEQREAFSECLETERDSIATGREALTDLLDPLDGPRIPAWHRDEFEDELTDVAETRQETVRSRDRLGHIDGIDLCTYLYDDAEWTYPVLTAVARLRNAVEYRSDPDDAATATEPTSD